MRDLVRAAVAGHTPRELPLEGRLPAAILLLLHGHTGDEHVLFQVRTQRVEHHKGEISLPGGARDPGDRSLEETALRETQEELGVDPARVEIFGRLDDVPTRSNFVMTPFVGVIEEGPRYPFRFAPLEVDELLEVPLSALRRGERLEWTPASAGQLMPAFRHDKHLIFGATARVLYDFLQLLDRTELASPDAAR